MKGIDFSHKRFDCIFQEELSLYTTMSLTFFGQNKSEIDKKGLVTHNLDFTTTL